jgi:hypothetical protein
MRQRFLSRRRTALPAWTAGTVARAIVVADAVADIVARRRPIVETARLLVAAWRQSVRSAGPAILSGAAWTRPTLPILIADGIAEAVRPCPAIARAATAAGWT